MHIWKWFAAAVGVGLLAIVLFGAPASAGSNRGCNLSGSPLFAPSGDARNSAGGPCGIKITSGYERQGGRYYHPRPGPWRNQWHPGAPARRPHYGGGGHGGYMYDRPRVIPNPPRYLGERICEHDASERVLRCYFVPVR